MSVTALEHTEMLKEVCELHKLPKHNPDQLELIPTGPAEPVFKVRFNIYVGTGRDLEGKPDKDLDDVYVQFKGDDAHFPWAELELECDRKNCWGIEPSDYGGEMESDRWTSRRMAAKLKAAGFTIVSYFTQEVVACQDTALCS